jgi:stage II sporulation protein D
MSRKLILILLIEVQFSMFTYGQVRIRLFSSQTPESALFSVTCGRYELNTFNGKRLQVDKNEPLLITRFNGKLAVKSEHIKGFVCDSLVLLGKKGDDSFTLRINDGTPVRHSYSGDLQCFPDLGTIVMINNCDFEKYITGVVKAEGGSGRNKEYSKTQAILARTYMYKYFNRHLADRYNLCDGTHCQAFNGLSDDSVIIKAVQETRGLVILDRDSILIMSAFHSNCGGETSSSEDVWLTSQPYLKRVVDPYCITSHNAIWEKHLSLKSWIDLMKEAGYEAKTGNPAAFNFMQKKRQDYYRTGSFMVPLSTLRTQLNLRSTFFSVFTYGDSIILKGRGYGHGVGLCQEGAMVMAGEGRNYMQIIDFYYSGTIISDIKNALFLNRNSTTEFHEVTSTLKLSEGTSTLKPSGGGL